MQNTLKIVRDCLQESYTHFIASYPWLVLCATVAVAAALTSGMYLQDKLMLTDAIDLYSPADARSTRDLAALESMRFGLGEVTTNRRDVLRVTTLVFTAKRGANPNIFRKDAMREIKSLNDYLTGMNVTREGTNFTFRDFCSVDTLGNCKSLNEFIDHIDKALIEGESSKPFSTEITYPTLPGTRFVPGFYVANLLGHVSLENGTNIVAAFQSLLLIFYSDPVKSKYQQLWEKQLLREVIDFNATNIANLSVEYLLSTAIADAFKITEVEMKPRFVATMALIVAIAVISQLRFKRRKSDGMFVGLFSVSVLK